MKSTITKKLKRVIETGKTPHSDSWLTEKIRLVNLMSLVNLFLVLGMIVVDFFVSKTHWLSIVAAFIGLIMMIPYYLNYRRRYIGARIAFLILAYVSICFLAVVFGKVFFFQYYLVPGVGMSLIFFRNEIGRKKWIFVFVGIPLWIFLEVWFTRYSPLIAIEGPFVDFIPYFSSFLIFVTAITMVAAFTRESDMQLEAIQMMNYRLKEMANRDSLTGLYNRRFITEQLLYFFGFAKRGNGLLAMAIFDLDHFKEINDTYGHDAGDKVLQTIAQLARDNLRETDLVGRIGGEEFCILFTSGEREKIREAIERFRNAIRNMTVRYDDASISITASFGLAHFSSALERHEDLFRNADSALYRAKHTGRNRLCEYDSR